MDVSESAIIKSFQIYMHCKSLLLKFELVYEMSISKSVKDVEWVTETENTFLAASDIFRVPNEATA